MTHHPCGYFSNVAVAAWVMRLALSSCRILPHCSNVFYIVQPYPYITMHHEPSRTKNETRAAFQLQAKYPLSPWRCESLSGVQPRLKLCGDLRIQPRCQLLGGNGWHLYRGLGRKQISKLCVHSWSSHTTKTSLITCFSETAHDAITQWLWYTSYTCHPFHFTIFTVRTRSIESYRIKSLFQHPEL